MVYTPPRGQYPVHDAPDHHPGHPKETNETIYGFLSSNPRFTLITKALNYEEDIAALLKDPSANVTFFAPPDAALRRKHGHHRPPHKQRPAFWDGMSANPLSVLEHTDLAAAVDLIDNVHPDHPGDPEKRKKIIKFILHVILSYHVIDGEYDIEKLGAHNTIPSHLKFRHVFDNQPIRLRVGSTLLPSITINFFSKIFLGVSATNGYVHVVSHPIIPPPSVFQELYMVPEHFSTLTSALQRSNLTQLVDFRHVRHRGHASGFEGSNLVTVFAPTNHAFQTLPRKLKLFLFSPFGERVLQKLLRFHIVPDVAFFSDYVRPEKVEEGLDFVDLGASKEDGENPSRRWFFDLVWPRPRGPVVEPISCEKYSLDTALFNHTLNIIVDKKRVTLPSPHHKRSVIKTHIIVNHHLVYLHDVVGVNGAIHVIDRLLDPRKHCDRPPKHGDQEDDQAWEDWEEWLPQWADEK
jgi:uncharacterized surface protein with fasciclin (FAS1) repeats